MLLGAYWRMPRKCETDLTSKSAGIVRQIRANLANPSSVLIEKLVGYDPTSWIPPSRNKRSTTLLAREAMRQLMIIVLIQLTTVIEMK
jgi:hypothetical protein